jgi:hypothetical protein
MSEADGKQEPRAVDGKGRQRVNHRKVHAGVGHPHGMGSGILPDAHLPARWGAPIYCKGSCPYAVSSWRWKAVLRADSLQSQPFSNALLVGVAEYGCLILNHRSENGLCATLDIAHPPIVAAVTDAFHRKARPLFIQPLLPDVRVVAFGPPFVATHNNSVRSRRWWLGSHQDLTCPRGDNVLRAGGRLAAKNTAAHSYGVSHCISEKKMQKTRTGVALAIVDCQSNAGHDLLRLNLLVNQAGIR